MAYTQLKDIVSWLSQRHGEKTFDSNVRRSVFRLYQAGIVELTDRSGTPCDIMLSAYGYQQALNLQEKITLGCDVFRSSGVCISLPVRQGTVLAKDKEVMIDRQIYFICRADFVIRSDGKTFLQLKNKKGELKLIAGTPLVVARWYKQALEAGVACGVQINEGKPG